MRYRVLGFAVWNGAKWYVRCRYTSSRRYVVVGVVGAAIAGVLIAGARRGTE